MKERTFAFRISEQDYRLLRSKAAHGKITMTDLILRSVKDKEIVVVQGLPETMAEMKALGRKKSERVNRKQGIQLALSQLRWRNIQLKCPVKTEESSVRKHIRQLKQEAPNQHRNRQQNQPDNPQTDDHKAKGFTTADIGTLLTKSRCLP